MGKASLPNCGLHPIEGIPDSSVGKESACNAENSWSDFLGREDPLEEEMATPSSNSCLENPMGRGAWRATIHGLAESDTTE